MAQGGSNKKVANSLVAASAAAVLAVYSAGYVRTRSAAAHFEEQTVERRPVVPDPPLAAAPVEQVRPAEQKPVKANLAPARPEVPAVEAQPAPVVPEPTPEPPARVAENKAEIAVAPTPPPAPAPPPSPMWKDGTYFGWGTSRHGNIQAQVVIEGGRIASATISECRTRYSCSVIDRLPPEVAQRQSPDVDYVSGATQSANAFYYAVVEALSKAK